MGYDVRRLRSVASVPFAEMVETVKVDYPKFDKPLLSKCMSPEAYGVAMIPSVVRKLAAKFDPEGWEQHKGKENRALPCSIRCRMTESEYKRLMAKIKEDGFITAQAWAHSMLLAYIGEEADDDGLGCT